MFHDVFYLTFKQIALHARNIYCEGLLMCMSNYFLMYVIPSVMVQSYICYVTKPVVKVELSKFCSRVHI